MATFTKDGVGKIITAYNEYIIHEEWDTVRIYSTSLVNPITIDKEILRVILENVDLDSR